jgi:hypothetical protein
LEEEKQHYEECKLLMERCNSILENNNNMESEEQKEYNLLMKEVYLILENKDKMELEKEKEKEKEHYEECNL